MFIDEYRSVRHILTAPSIATRTAPYIGEDDFDFAWLESERETMSGGESLLVGIASELWFATKQVGLWEVTRRLDSASFGRVLDALSIARVGAVPELRAREEAMAA